MWKRQSGSKIIYLPHGDQSLGKHAVKVKMLHSYALKQWMPCYFSDEIYLRVSRHYVQITAVPVGKFDGTFWETFFLFCASLAAFQFFCCRCCRELVWIEAFDTRDWSFTSGILCVCVVCVTVGFQVNVFVMTSKCSDRPNYEKNK